MIREEMGEMWLARSKYGSLILFIGSKAPIKYESEGLWHCAKSDTYGISLPSKLFPEVQWSDKEPTKVKLIINK